MNKTLLVITLFSLSIFLIPSITNAHADFSGSFDTSNWVLVNTPSSLSGTVDTSLAPSTISITGSNSGCCISGDTFYNYDLRMPNSCTLEFDWVYDTRDFDPSYDTSFYLVNGHKFGISDPSASSSNHQSGHESVAISAGSSFGFSVYTFDNRFGSATLQISNFDESNVCGSINNNDGDGGDDGDGNEQPPVMNHRHDDTTIPPPNLAGHENTPISDGFTINDDSFTIPATTLNLLDIPTHALVKGEKQTIIVKAYSDSALGYETTHMSLNFAPHPIGNIANSVLSLIWDNGVTSVVDPQGLVSDVNAEKTSDGKIDTLTFTFTPQKDMVQSDILIRAWNNKLASYDYVMQNAVKFTGEFLTPMQAQLPSFIKMYENISDLNNQLAVDGFEKPSILSHIHDTVSVFGDNTGSVYWLYDTQGKSVSLVIDNESGKTVNVQTSNLVEQTPQITSDYSNLSMSRNNISELESAKSTESLKALNLMMDLYGKDYIIQYNLVG